MQELARALGRFAEASHQPTSFAERGIAVAFTSPSLLGARVRPSRRGLELIVPNPAGGRGSYVLPWEAAGDLCTLTVHDRMLLQAAADLPLPSPTAIRDAVRRLAMAGHAGRAPARAARDAIAAEQAQRMRTNFRLLMRLVSVVEGRTVDPAGVVPSALEVRAKRATASVAAHLRTTPEAIAEWLEELAACLEGIGDPDDLAPARIPRLMTPLRQLADQVEGWGRDRGDPEEEAESRLVVAAARLTVRCLEEVVDDLHRQVQPVPMLLARWQADAPALRQALARPDWLVDGWAALCALWEAAAPPDRALAVHEIAGVLPVLPREVRDWVGIEVASVEVAGRRRRVALSQDWRTGVTQDLVRRNERLVTASAA